MWTGTALNTTQLDAETLASAPATPNFRYTFASDATNTGSTSGNDGTPNNGVFLCGDNLDYGPPFVAAEADHAFPMTWNGSSEITVAALTSNRFWTGAPGFSPLASGPVAGGIAVVATEPTSASGTPVQSCVYGIIGSGGDQFLTTYRSGSTIHCDGNAAGPNISNASAIRVLHSRRDGASSSRVIGLQDGTGSEATTTSGSFTATEPTMIIFGGGPQSTNSSDPTFHALVVLDGTITSGQRSTINTWASTNHGATV